GAPAAARPRGFRYHGRHGEWMARLARPTIPGGRARVTTLRPVLCGEILFDTWPDGTAVLGGAPVNVAVHLARLGERPLMIGRVGADAAGDRARAELAAHGVDTSGVQVDPRAPTGRVEVVLEAGQPRYEIVPDAAWDALDAAAAATALATAGPAL